MSDGVFWPEFKTWLELHGIEVNECAEVVIRFTPASVHGYGAGFPVCLEATMYRQRDGKPYLDEKGGVATETRTIPLRCLPSVNVARYLPATGPAAPGVP
jgi:hypothetical protein